MLQTSRPFRITIAAALLCSPSILSAETLRDVPTTTGVALKQLDWLQRFASCKGFSDAMLRAREADANDKDVLTTLFALAFMEGYAQGSGRGVEGRAEFLIQCLSNPSRPFSTVGK